MRVRFVMAFAALLPLFAPVVAAGPAASADLTPVGLWQGADDTTKQPSGWFLISNHDGVYTGIIAKMFMKPGENPNAVCDQCKDDRLNHPWLGLEIIRDMKQEEPDKYGGGTILDPRDGKVYKATLKVSPDGQTLAVHGYVLAEVFGKNVYWTRLPDSAYSMLNPSINPNAAAKRPPAAMAPAPHKSDLQLRLNSSQQ